MQETSGLSGYGYTIWSPDRFSGSFNKDNTDFSIMYFLGNRIASIYGEKQIPISGLDELRRELDGFKKITSIDLVVEGSD